MSESPQKAFLGLPQQGCIRIYCVKEKPSRFSNIINVSRKVFFFLQLQTKNIYFSGLCVLAVTDITAYLKNWNGFSQHLSTFNDFRAKCQTRWNSLFLTFDVTNIVKHHFFSMLQPFNNVSVTPWTKWKMSR